MKQILFILFFAIAFSSLSFSQKQVRKDIREGNKEYKQGSFTDAEIDYRRALEGNARSTEAAYNLGNSLYKQQKLQEALEQYQAIVNNETDKNKLSKAWHNTGNVFLATGDLPKSIAAYKNALRNNPKDEETRYNLALAQKMLEDQQNEDQQQDQQKQEQEQQQEQEQEQEQNQDQKQNQDQQEQEQQQQQEEQQQSPNEMSKENADQILDALMQDEKDTQEKVKAEQMKQQKQRRTDKNW